jgi:hypothetical protein
MRSTREPKACANQPVRITLQGYYGYRHLLMQQAVQNAALAAGNKITTYTSPR